MVFASDPVRTIYPPTFTPRINQIMVKQVLECCIFLRTKPAFSWGLVFSLSSSCLLIQPYGSSRSIRLGSTLLPPPWRRFLAFSFPDSNSSWREGTLQAFSLCLRPPDVPHCTGFRPSRRTEGILPGQFWSGLHLP